MPPHRSLESQVPDHPESSSSNPGSSDDKGVASKPPTGAPTKPPVRASVVLSDMAPSFTGDRDTDQGRVAALVLDAFAACVGDESRYSVYSSVVYSV